MKPLGKVKIEWSPKFAYTIGLLVTDGNLSSDGRHMSLVSKDKELIELFAKCLNLKNIISKRRSDSNRYYFKIQFGDVKFYDFLLKIGLMPNKSKIIKSIDVPKEFFFDFLRGHFDGDGSSYSYFDPRWPSSYMFYTVFVSASKSHVLWLQGEIYDNLKIKGHITKSINNSAYQLKFAKRESLQLLPKIYYNKRAVCLLRKYFKIEKALKVINKSM